MRRETIAIHGGYEVDPVTRAVAVPIYQTVAYAFDRAEDGAALFHLEVEQTMLWSGGLQRWKARSERSA